MKMYGKLGWYGQCACCCGKADKAHIKQEEERQWLRDWNEEDDSELYRRDRNKFGYINLSETA